MIQLPHMPCRVLTLIPAFNCAETLEEAVLSALMQDGIADTRVLICDDASTDDTPRIIARLREAWPGRVAGIRNDINLMAGATRNRLIDHVRHELGRGWLDGYRRECFIAFLDADDICLPDRFLRQARHLAQNPGCRMVGGQLIVFGQNAAGLLAFPTDADEIRVRSLFETVNLPSTYFCTVDTIFSPNFRFSDLRHGEDWEFFIRNQRWLNYENLDAPVCRYRRHAANSTSDLTDAVDSIATRLRLHYLSDALGVEASLEEIKLHITISPCKFWRPEEQAHFWRLRDSLLDDGDRWFAKLARANLIRQFVPAETFSRAAAQIRQSLAEALKAPMPSRFRFDL